MVQYSSSNRVMDAKDRLKNGASLKNKMSMGNIKKKTFLFFVTLCFITVSTFAQDVITLKNGDDIQSLVQEIGEVEIKYKKFENPNGPNYTLKKSDIFMIRYTNGSKDVFANIAEPKETDNEPIVEQSALNNNSSANANFILKKNDKIAVRVYGLRLAKKNMKKSLEKKLRELGFCCIYSNIKNENVTSMDIVVHPDGASSFRFGIFDKSLKEGEVFAASYRWSTMFTLNKVVDNFIKDISPFIER